MPLEQESLQQFALLLILRKDKSCLDEMSSAVGNFPTPNQNATESIKVIKIYWTSPSGQEENYEIIQTSSQRSQGLTDMRYEAIGGQRPWRRDMAMQKSDKR